MRHLKREEREKFIGSFVQAKNLIEKQMKIGNHIRDKKTRKDDNKKKVLVIKSAKADEQMALPITTKQIDGAMLMDADVSTQRSSTHAFYSESAAKPGFSLKRGRSQQMKSETATDISMARQGSGRVRGALHSSNKRNPGNVGVQRSMNVPPGMGQANMNRANMMFPPLGETSFSE